MQRALSLVLAMLIGLSCVACGGNSTDGVAAEGWGAERESSDASWGPERPTFTMKDQADHVTFNSITDNPQIGDERNFVRLRKADGAHRFDDDVDLEVGQEYEVGIWFHNDADPELDGRDNDGVGIAHNVRLSMEHPELVNGGTSAVIRGTISSTNASPEEVWDEAFAYTESTVSLRYVPNSAVIHSSGDIDGEVLSSEVLFGDEGAKLGYYKDYWGTLPGGEEYAGYFTYHFVVDQPDFEMSKTASREGAGHFAEQVTVAPGDVIDFRIEYENTGTTNQLDITGHDKLPQGLTYIPGSSFFTSNTNREGNTISDGLFDEGVNLGDYRPGDSMTLTYKAQVSDDSGIFPQGDTTIYNEASIATANGTGHDKVEIIVHRD